MTGLTPRQSDALSFIRSHQAKNGFSPSYDEIAAGIGLASRSRAFDLVKGLERRGAVRTRPGMNRTIEIIEGQGADFHLKRILDAVSCSGFIGLTDPIIAEAQSFLGRQA
ncbi:hypothetical protein [Mesorhizobium sp.]|uniref:LexA family protein n=1 Tax=Mesorhizobium sp. TaxID=1871066 RepID=UPI000FE67F2A|nr:hypothetical protein [Mesorhizobium sp.]RWB29619.1 MAG: hypothetical protein EOQ41_16030 [Mesorhizobium sp.]RWE96444.1 MAG: hypothetical protein EOS43_22335 [Mesorhizobium sp.]